MAGLALSDIVSVTVQFAASSTSTRNFGAALIVGSSGVLATAETMRTYTSLAGVGNDFATTTAEYAAATAFFSASPTPGLLYIGALQSSETLAACAQRLAAASSDWYCLLPSAPIVDSGIAGALACAQVIEAMSPSRIVGFTGQTSAVVSSTNTADLASAMKSSGYTRTFVQYSSSNPYAAAALFGRFATVNYDGSGTIITGKFQSEPGITAENLTETQAATLLSKRCNVFVGYQGGIAIVQEGVMSSAYYIDERIGLDWLQNALQVAGVNALVGAGTKIPQTDAGMTFLLAEYEAVLDQAVANGLLAPGTYTGPSFGALTSGATLTKGYYCYMPPVSSQSAADRAARKAVVATIACKLAGAVHSSSVVVNVVR